MKEGKNKRQQVQNMVEGEVFKEILHRLATSFDSSQYWQYNTMKALVLPSVFCGSKISSVPPSILRTLVEIPNTALS